MQPSSPTPMTTPWCGQARVPVSQRIGLGSQLMIMGWLVMLLVFPFAGANGDDKALPPAAKEAEPSEPKDEPKGKDAEPEKKDAQPDQPEEKPAGEHSKHRHSKGFRTSLLEGEETFEPLGAPLSTEEAEKLEAKKLFVIAYMQIERNQLNQALETLETALKHDPNSPAILRQLAFLCLKLEKGPESLEYASKALKLLPEDHELWHAYALRNEEDGNFDAAIRALEQASKIEGLADEDPQEFFRMRLQLARLYGLKGNNDGVIASMKDVIDVAENPAKYRLDEHTIRQLDRSKFELYRQLGMALKDAKKYEEATEVLEKGRQSSDRGRNLAVDLAEVHFEKGDYDKALAELDAYLKLPDERGLTLYAKTLEKKGKGDELLPALARMTQVDPNNQVLRRFYGEKLLDADQFEKAREQLLKVKDRPETLPLLTRLFRKMNQPKELLDAFTESMSTPSGQEALLTQIRALAQDKEFVLEVAKVARERGNEEKRDVPQFFADYIVAKTAREAGNIDLAKEFYERCITDRPEVSALYVELTEMLLLNKRYEDVIAVTQRAIDKKVSGEYVFHDFQARALAMLDRTDEAVALIDKVIGRLADSELVVEANILLAWIYQRAQQWDKAEEVCNRVITEFPGVRQIPQVRYVLSNIYSLAGNMPKAEEQLEQLIESDPRTLPREIFAGANNDLGYLWADEGKNLDRAESMIRRALEISPGNAAYLDSMGWVLFKQGKFDQAIDYLKQATALETGDDAVIWDHLGDAYRKSDKLSEARKAWEKAVELYKKDPREKERAKIKDVEKKLEFLDSSEAEAPPRARAGEP
ncbi:MAG: tetratricopeptide repeat protein [Planctomycetota bacterium]